MTPLPLPLPVCLHGELLRGDLPLLCLLKGFTSVSALFHIQGLRLKFVSPWRLRVVPLSLLASPLIFLLWAWLVLCGHQLHGLRLVCSSRSLRLGRRRWDTQNSACTDPVVSPRHISFIGLLHPSDEFYYFSSFLSFTCCKRPKPPSFTPVRSQISLCLTVAAQRPPGALIAHLDYARVSLRSLPW